MKIGERKKNKWKKVPKHTYTHTNYSSIIKTECEQDDLDLDTLANGNIPNQCTYFIGLNCPSPS